MKMLQPVSMRNLKFSAVIALINCRVGTWNNGLCMSILDAGACRSNAPLIGISRIFLDVPGQHPAEIGKAIQVTQDLSVKILFVHAERSDVSLGAAARCAG